VEFARATPVRTSRNPRCVPATSASHCLGLSVADRSWLFFLRENLRASGLTLGREPSRPQDHGRRNRHATNTPATADLDVCAACAFATFTTFRPRSVRRDRTPPILNPTETTTAMYTTTTKQRSPLRTPAPRGCLGFAADRLPAGRDRRRQPDGHTTTFNGVSGSWNWQTVFWHNRAKNRADVGSRYAALRGRRIRNLSPWTGFRPRSHASGPTGAARRVLLHNSPRRAPTDGRFSDIRKSRSKKLGLSRVELVGGRPTSEPR